MVDDAHEHTQSSSEAAVISESAASSSAADGHLSRLSQCTQRFTSTLFAVAVTPGPIQGGTQHCTHVTLGAGTGFMYE